MNVLGVSLKSVDVTAWEALQPEIELAPRAFVPKGLLIVLLGWLISYGCDALKTNQLQPRPGLLLVDLAAEPGWLFPQRRVVEGGANSGKGLIQSDGPPTVPSREVTDAI